MLRFYETSNMQQSVYSSNEKSVCLDPSLGTSLVGRTPTLTEAPPEVFYKKSCP